MHLLFCLLLARLYSNALLGTLNSRSPIFGGSHSTQDTTSSSRRRAYNSGVGSSLGSIKKGDYKKKFDGKITVNSDTISDYESGVVRAYDEEGQVISYEPAVPTYPLSPMAPSYRTQRPDSAKTAATLSPSPPPSAKGLLQPYPETP